VTWIWLLSSPPDKTGRTFMRCENLQIDDDRQFPQTLATAKTAQDVYDIIQKQENSLYAIDSCHWRCRQCCFESSTGSKLPVHKELRAPIGLHIQVGHFFLETSAKNLLALKVRDNRR